MHDQNARRRQEGENVTGVSLSPEEGRVQLLSLLHPRSSRRAASALRVCVWMHVHARAYASLQLLRCIAVERAA